MVYFKWRDRSCLLALETLLHVEVGSVSTSESTQERRRHGSSRRADAIIGGVFLIGLAVLFYFNLFWPWILALVGLVVILEALLRSK
jgi:divalent metal cation (Fe/Co/Zn/Cd) transporter